MPPKSFLHFGLPVDRPHVSEVGFWLFRQVVVDRAYLPAGHLIIQFLADHTIINPCYWPKKHFASSTKHDLFMINQQQLNELRDELAIKAKNGLDFTCAASLIWLAISFVWTLNITPYNQSILTFCVGAPLLPVAFVLSKVFKTTWTIRTNPLQPLGLWLNFAQLFYFPLLFFVLGKMSLYFAMTYAIITGAHFFPYSWFYRNTLYAVFAGVISIGSLFLALSLPNKQMYFVPLFVGASLAVLTILLHLNYQKRQQSNLTIQSQKSVSEPESLRQQKI